MGSSKYQQVPQGDSQGANAAGASHSTSFDYPNAPMDPVSSFSPGAKDRWATVLFTLNWASIIAISWAGYAKGDNPLFSPDIRPNKDSQSSPEDSPVLAYVAPILVASLLSGFLLTLGFLILLQRFAGKFIWASFLVNIGLSLVFAVLALFSGNLLMALFGGISVLIHIFMYTSWKKRIPFATVLLETVVSVTRAYPATIFAGVIGIVVQSVYMIFWAAATTFAAASFLSVVPSESGDDGKQLEISDLGYVVLVYYAFSYFWNSQVIKNTVHVTIAGVFGTYYFQGISSGPGTANVVVPVNNPTLRSAKRALTTSFGSIAFGSLIIAALETVRMLARAARDQSRRSDHNGAAILLACAECIVGCIEGALEFLNVYAYTQVAMYGKSYCDAAHATWELVKSRGVDLIINDDLVGSVLGLASLFVAVAAAAVTAACAWVWAPSAPSSVFVVAAVVGGLAALLQFSCLATVIASGTATTFVAIALDPGALKRTKPAMWAAVVSTYHERGLAVFQLAEEEGF